MENSGKRLQKLLLRKSILENQMIRLHREIERFEREVQMPNPYFHDEYVLHLEFKKGTLDEVEKEHRELLIEVDKASEIFTEALSRHFKFVDASKSPTPQTYEGLAIKTSFIDELD